MASLHQFTMELDLHRDSLHCKNCAGGNDFISHGFVFEKCSQGEPRKVGKRLLCANRHGRSGCGATLRLYLSAGIPRLKYSAVVMTLFLTALLQGLSIQQAYQSATRTDDPRNAYRWLRGVVSPNRRNLSVHQKAGFLTVVSPLLVQFADHINSACLSPSQCDPASHA